MPPRHPRSTLFPYTTLFRSIETLTSQISGGTFEIRFMEPGALVPALQVMDSVSNGSVEAGWVSAGQYARSEEHTSELQSLAYLVCRLLLEKKNKKSQTRMTY